MERQYGKIVWISGFHGLRRYYAAVILDENLSLSIFSLFHVRTYVVVGIPERTSNIASKFAIDGYCEGMRAELATSGVQVFVAYPGNIQTNLSKSALMAGRRRCVWHGGWKDC